VKRFIPWALAGAFSLPLAAPAAEPCHHHEAPPAAEAAKGESLYQLDARLTDQQGRAAKLDAFKGHPVAIAMFYGSCTTVCPLIISDLQRLQKGIGKDDDLRILLVSLDPERDTPASLAKLAAEHGVDANWRLTVTSAESVQEIAAVLGVRYKKMPDGSISHSALITLLDRDGVPDTRVEGVMQPLDGIIARVHALSQKEARP
jgi:protein SCO1/2